MSTARRCRVLFVLPSLRRAGAETQVVNLVSGMDQALFEPHVFTFERDQAQRSVLEQAGVTYHHHLRQMKYDFAYTGAIAKLIDELEIDVLHCSLQFALLAGWLARRQARRKPPLVAAVHTTVNRSLKEELQDRLLYRWLLQGCAGVVFVCEAQRQYWMRRYPALRPLAHTIYNGIDPERFSLTPEVEKETVILRGQRGVGVQDTVITAVAGFRPEKRHDLLIEAFATLPENVHLFLAGDGEMRAATEVQVRARGLDKRVHFLGAVSDIRPVLVASTATVLASTAVETFSMAVLESMSMNVPAIVPDLSGLPEAVEHGVGGFVYPTGDVDALAGCLRQMVALSPSEQKAIGQAARERLLQNFTEMQMVERTQALLMDVVTL